MTESGNMSQRVLTMEPGKGGGGGGGVEAFTSEIVSARRAASWELANVTLWQTARRRKMHAVMSQSTVLKSYVNPVSPDEREFFNILG